MKFLQQIKFKFLQQININQNIILKPSKIGLFQKHAKKRGHKKAKKKYTYKIVIHLEIQENKETEKINEICNEFIIKLLRKQVLNEQMLKKI